MILGLWTRESDGTPCARLSKMGHSARSLRLSSLLGSLAWLGLSLGLSLVFVSESSAQIAGAKKKPTQQVAPKDCTASECHQDVIAHKYVHDQKAADCAACHLQIGKAEDHQFALPAKPEDLCVKCHQLPAKKHAHLPMTEGKCMSCHDPHGSEHKHELRGDPNKDLCIKCHHKTDVTNKKFVHGPVAVGACSTCHVSHSSDEPKLLQASPNALCMTCHEETGRAEDGVHLHKALEQGCVNCHDPHATDHKFQLVEDSPKLCLSCHQEKFDQMTAGAKVVHQAVSQDGGCPSCHSPHSSKLPGLQRASEVTTCLKCHDRQIKKADGKVISNMAKLLETNPIKHGPIRDGHCTVCHDPHAGPHFSLLSDEYPAKFYSAFSMDNYKLCFRCHSADMVTKEDGTGVTMFRDGTRNLHALHVNKDNGRTCRACHEVHASTRPAHVRESVPYGTSNWMLEINYEASEEGGSCAPGCHQVKKYVRPAGPRIQPLDDTGKLPSNLTGKKNNSTGGGNSTSEPATGAAPSPTPTPAPSETPKEPKR